MRASAALATEVAEAARVMSRLSLVTAFGHVSARLGDDILVTPPVDLTYVGAGEVVLVPLDANELPAGAPPETWLHLAVYRSRPDVLAVARAQPESSFVAGAVATELAPLHGQASWLGRRVPVHPGTRLLRSAALAASAADSLGDSEALVLRGNGGVTTGVTPGIAVARMWLLDVACRVHVQARQAGEPRPLADEDVDAWRAAAPALLDRLWAHLLRTTTEGRQA
ncbi:class II aldolase/adducin family protein [Amycolatopsis sp.]|uniref:class II aldolase/adducin family protein n=1 Tax=Amycolatopsis sp. TaxID=37632 RepID=UPI00260787C5|nr:class II aldolase/adducin family protein [Amycolatopsis sp.]